MEFGICMFVTNYSMQAADLAQAVEERDFDALFIPDHTHIPASRQSPFTIGEELPPDYSHNVDVFLALAAAAAVTKRIRLGTGICLVVERDPIITAKEVASLDHMSGGRFDFGIGGGWNQEEMENHGVAFTDRWKVLRERILAMREIWREEEAEFQGQFVNFDRIWSYPKPMQAGGPPVLLGASSKYVYQRIAEYGDGWFPLFQDARRIGAGGAIDYAEGITKTREAWDKQGREGIPDFTIFGVTPETLFKVKKKTLYSEALAGTFSSDTTIENLKISVRDLNKDDILQRKLPKNTTGVVVTEIFSLGVMKSPGDMGADIVACEGQSLGNSLNFGGPYVGLLSTRKKYLRQLPGRIVGESEDVDGRKGFVLTLSAREQHIRREKATSNICTNSGLCSLAFTIHLTLLGELGFKKLSLLNHEFTCDFHDMVSRLPGFEVVSKSFYNEFTLKLPINADDFLDSMSKKGILAGIPIKRLLPENKNFDNYIIVACTEMNSKDDFDQYVNSAKEIAS